MQPDDGPGESGRPAPGSRSRLAAPPTEDDDAAAGGLDPEAVTELLRRHIDPDLVSAGIRRGPVGNSQETWFVEARGPNASIRELVIRRSAASGTLEHTDRVLEHAILGALSSRGFPVPEVHWLEVDSPALERPNFAMDRMPGHAAARLPSPAREAVARELGDRLAQLHALDPSGLGLDLEVPADVRSATCRELRGWREEYERRRLEPVPLLGALFAWLEAHVPAGDGPPALLWGDPGPHNILVEANRLTAMLDWELAHLGHPLEDLGAAVWACLGALDEDEVVAGYEARAGQVDREALRFFEVFACVTRSVMVLAGVSAYLRGESRPALAGLGQDLLLRNLARAVRAAGWGEPPEPPAPVGADVSSPLRLRPDVPETADGVARFLRERILPSVTDARTRGDLKTAVALLDTVAHRSVREPAVLDERLRTLEALGIADAAALEEAAVEAEHTRSAGREALRRHLLVDLAAQRSLIAPLSALYEPRPRSGSL